MKDVKEPLISTKHKVLAGLVAASVLTVGLAAAPLTASAASCAPAGSVWSNSAQYTGEPDGDDSNSNPLDLNNNQWNMQSSSQQTMYLVSSGGTFGLCSVYQPSSPNGVKSYPDINDNFSNNDYALSSYSAVKYTYTETNFPTNATGDYQFMTDSFAQDSSGNSNAIEIEIITYRHESGSPGGTQVGTTTLAGNSYKIYKNTALSDGHTYYSFVINSNVTSATADVLGAYKWLETNEGLSSSAPLYNASVGWEISDIQSSTGGVVSGPSVTSFTTQVSRS